MKMTLKKTKRILVVDDDTQIVRLLSLRLKANNFDVSVAYDGLQGVQVAKVDLPDLILLDINTPHGGGIRALENLKAMADTSKIPVIIITAYASKEVKRLVLELGANDLISKPFNNDELMEKIKAALGSQNISPDEMWFYQNGYRNNIIFDNII